MNNTGKRNHMKKAESQKSNAVGSLSFSAFDDFMNQDRILDEVKMFMSCFNKEIVFDSDEEPQHKMILHIESVWKVRLYLKNFYDKYSYLELNKVLTVLKEEWIKECFILNKYGDHFQALNSDKELWLLSYFLECSSWYNFSSVVTPSKLGLPEGRTALEYYHMLKIMMDQDLQGLGNSGANGSNDNNDSGENGSDGDTDSGDDGSDGESDSQGDGSGEDNDSEGDPEDGNASSGEESNAEASDGQDSFSLEDIMNSLKKHGMSDDELELMRSSFEEAEEYTDPSCGKGLNSDKGILEYLKNDRNSDGINDLFRKINKYISSVESEMKISKCSNRPSYYKYSWKTDARADGIVYPGNKRINGGLTRKFKMSPVVFFDFSGSTLDINQCLNDLAYKFWTEGYTVCVYNHNLQHVVEPEDSSFFHFPSDGGTDTLLSVIEYFESKGGCDEDRNIYAITDGNEHYEALFRNFKRTTIFQITENCGCKQLSKWFLDSNGKIQTVDM